MGRLVVLALLLAGSSASAQTVRLHVLADSVTVGEQFEVAVAVEHAAGVQALFPEPPGVAETVASPLETGDAELLDLRRLPPKVRGTVRLDSAVFEATTFALDSAAVGPIPIRLVRGTDTTVARSPAVYLGVRSLVPNDANPKGLAPLADFPRAWGPWLIAALLVLAGVAALAWWLRRRNAVAIETSTLPPYEEAAVRLRRLEEGLPEHDDAVKAFYVELADTLRTYLARSLGVPARELTTRELLDLLRCTDHVSEEAHGALGDVLRRADFVKFAEFIPDATIHTATLARALRAVEPIEASLHPEPEPDATPEPAA